MLTLHERWHAFSDHCVRGGVRENEISFSMCEREHKGNMTSEQNERRIQRQLNAIEANKRRKLKETILENWAREHEHRGVQSVCPFDWCVHNSHNWRRNSHHKQLTRARISAANRLAFSDCHKFSDFN